MYICIKKSIPSHKAVVIAHGVLMAHLKFGNGGDSSYNSLIYGDWLRNSFRKVVCEVTNEEFEKLKLEKDYIIVTESALDNQETALVFCPRYEWPKCFKFFPLLKI